MVDHNSIYTLQDKVLDIIFSKETTFYLTGGTCLNRFYHNMRYSDDLVLFTNENTLFRDDVRILIENLKSITLTYSIIVDTRDFVRLMIDNKLQVDLVNDRVYRYGKSIITSSRIKLDNIINICANKLCAVIGRDDPKDMFDIYTIYKKETIEWETVFETAMKKCSIDPEILEYRLSTFPLELLDLLKVVDTDIINEMKKGYSNMVEHLKGIIP